MEWIEAGRAGPAPVGRAMQRPAARDAALIPCRVGATEKRNASRAGAAPVPVAPTTGRNEIIASERARDRSLRGQRRAVPPPAVSQPAGPRPKAYVRIPGRGAVAPPRPRRMNRRRAASSPQPQAMHSRSKKRMEHPRTTWARFDETHCAMRVAMGHTVFRVLLPCHGLESSL